MSANAGALKVDVDALDASRRLGFAVEYRLKNKWRLSLGTALLRFAARILDCSIEVKNAEEAKSRPGIVTGDHPIVLELSRAMGINPDFCTGWTMEVKPDDIVLIEVRRNGETDSLGKLKEVVERRALTVSPPLLDVKNTNGPAPK